MINDLIKNFCLIIFALIGPITLPAGGIQRALNESKLPNNSKEIILNSNCLLYTHPNNSAKKLSILEPGVSLSLLRIWKVNEKDIWFRVELASNRIIDNPNKILRGWIKT